MHGFSGDVEAALLGLQSVDDCRVTRTPAGSAGQHVWTVTFIEVGEYNEPRFLVTFVRVMSLREAFDLCYFIRWSIVWLPRTVQTRRGVGAAAFVAPLLTLAPSSSNDLTASPSFYQKVRKRTGFGFAADDMGNMPAMEVDASRIRGTEANVEIRYSFGTIHVYY